MADLNKDELNEEVVGDSLVEPEISEPVFEEIKEENTIDDVLNNFTPVTEIEVNGDLTEINRNTVESKVKEIEEKLKKEYEDKINKIEKEATDKYEIWKSNELGREIIKYKNEMSDLMSEVEKLRKEKEELSDELIYSRQKYNIIIEDLKDDKTVLISKIEQLYNVVENYETEYKKMRDQEIYEQRMVEEEYLAEKELLRKIHRQDRYREEQIKVAAKKVYTITSKKYELAVEKMMADQQRQIEKERTRRMVEKKHGDKLRLNDLKTNAIRNAKKNDNYYQIKDLVDKVENK